MDIVSDKKTKKTSENQEMCLSFPLLLPMIAFILGILSGFLNISHTLSLSLSLVLLTLFILQKKFFSDKLSFYLSNCLILLMIYVFALQYAQFRTQIPPNDVRVLLQNQNEIQCKLSGVIVTSPKTYNQHQYFIIDIHQLNNTRIKGKLNLKAISDTLSAGQYIEGIVRFQAIKAQNPLEQSLEHHYLQKGIYGKGELLQLQMSLNNGKTYDKLNSIGDRLNFRIRQMNIKLQMLIERHIEKQFPKYSSLVNALLTGNKTQFEYDNPDHVLISYTHYRRAGILHILAVSGLHTALIFFCLYTLLKGINRNFARYSCVFILIVFAGICDYSASVVRAVTMIVVFLLSQILHRKQSFWQVLSVSVILILAVNPLQIRDVGFLLSVMAVIAIKFSQNLIAFHHLPMVSNHLRTLLYRGLGIIISTVFVSIFTSAIMFYFFQEINLNAIFSNLIVIPLFSILMPCTLILLFIPANSFLYTYLIKSHEFLITLFEMSLRLFSKLPLIFNYSMNIYQMLILSAYLFLLIILWNTKRLRIKRLFVLSFCSILLLFAFQNRFVPVNRVIYFNTGTSDAILIETDQKEQIVIDTGDIIENKAQIENNLLSYCLKKNIKEIDYVIITHPHSDHIGGLMRLSQKLKIKHLVVHHIHQKDSLYINSIKQSKISKVITMRDTFGIWLKNSHLQFIHPDASFFSENMNNNSIVCRWISEDHQYLFTGDIEEEAENYLLEHYPEQLNADILKIPHHGSRTSSQKLLIESINPKVGIITCAKENRFNFPHRQTLDTLNEYQVKTLITGIDGAVIIENKADNIEVSSMITQKRYYLIK